VKHSGNKLQVAYFDLLTGDYPVYDEVPDDAEYPLIQIGNNTFTDYTDNTSLGQEVTQTVWAVDRFEQAFGSRITLNEVTDFITESIRARPVSIDLEGFNVITSTLDIISFTKTRTDTHTYYRNEIRFRHLIEQLN
jgi:hypothetical protein